VRTFAVFTCAALLEIAGCFAFWAWLRQNRAPWLAALGVASLIGFAAVLTRAETAFAGRAYAAYGSVYIAASLAWLWAVERARPDRWDLLGVAICLAGGAVIVFGRR
jgi:small multidrug resistance family-3 protein